MNQQYAMLNVIYDAGKVAPATITDAINETLRQVAVDYKLDDSDDSIEFNWVWAFSLTTQTETPQPEQQVVTPWKCSTCDGSGSVTVGHRVIQCRECFEHHGEQAESATEFVGEYGG